MISQSCLFVITLLFFTQVFCLPNFYQNSPSDASSSNNGRRARQKEIPYHVAFRSRNFDFPFCSGVIIDSHWILTAADCLYYKQNDLQRIEVVYGATDLSDEGPGAVTSVEQVVIHPNYSVSLSTNNIALVKADGNLIQNKPRYKSGPVLMASQSNVIGLGDQAVITGFGKEGEGYPIPSLYLKKARVSVYNGNQCSRMFENYNQEQEFCAGRLGSGTCFDDPGPLVIDNKLIGFTSRCSTTENLASYSRISVYRDWIESVLTGSAYMEETLRSSS